MKKPVVVVGADLTMETALEGDFTLLTFKLLSGQELHKDEREFLARLLHTVQHPSRGHRMPEDEMETIAFAYRLLEVLDPHRQDKDIMSDICAAHDVKPSTVHNARRQHKIDPRSVHDLVELLGGRDKARRVLQSISAVYRKLDASAPN